MKTDAQSDFRVHWELTDMYGNDSWNINLHEGNLKSVVKREVECIQESVLPEWTPPAK